MRAGSQNSITPLLTFAEIDDDMQSDESRTLHVGRLRRGTEKSCFQCWWS